jgi:quinolinate synthase
VLLETAIAPVVKEAIAPAASCQAEGSLEELRRRSGLSAGALMAPLPQKYVRMSPAEVDAGIAAVRAKLGTRIVVLGHHYQRDEIIKYADYRGDSFKLAQLAAQRKEAEYIIFCGVHFMAESADVLRAPHQKVILPNLAAGCSMADMAPTDEVLDCWEDLLGIPSLREEVLIPITYMNSAAVLKAFCGQFGGAVCTSSNTQAVLKWAFERGKRVLYFPDQHLGRNMGLRLGIPLSQMPVWDPFQPLGGHEPADYVNARIILWKGHCSVHQRFTVDQVRQARERYPGIKIIAHPECAMEVVDEADCVGSTEQITKIVREAPAGSQFGIATEINMVNRLAQEHPDKLIFCLDPVVCPCATMYRIHPAYLLWVLEELLQGREVNVIRVDEETKKWAKVALERMLSIP